MVPVAQTIFSGPASNCFQACVASVLELPLVDVPNFALREGEWFGDLTLFLMAREMFPIVVEYDPFLSIPHGFTILSFVRETGRLHTVVAHEGCVAWDPAPVPNKVEHVLSNDRRSWLVFCVLDPSKLVGR